MLNIQTVEQQKQELEKLHQDKIYNYKKILYEYLKDKRKNLSPPSENPVQDLAFKWQIIFGSNAYFLSGTDADRYKVREYDLDTNAIDAFITGRGFEGQYNSEVIIEKQLIVSVHQEVPIYNAQTFEQMFKEKRKDISQAQDFNDRVNGQLAERGSTQYYERNHYQNAISLMISRYRMSYNMDYFEKNFVEPRLIQEQLDKIMLNIIETVRSPNRKFAWVENTPVRMLDVNIFYSQPDQVYDSIILKEAQSVSANPTTYKEKADYQSIAGFAAPYQNFFALARLRVFANKILYSVSEYRNGFYFLSNYADEITGYQEYQIIQSSSGIDQLVQQTNALKQLIAQQMQVLQDKFNLNTQQMAGAREAMGKNYKEFLIAMQNYNGGNIMAFRQYYGMSVQEAVQAIVEEEKPAIEIESAAIIYNRQQELLEQQSIKYQDELTRAFELRIQQQELTISDAEFIGENGVTISAIRNIQNQANVPNLQQSIAMLQQTNYNPYANIFNMFKSANNNYNPLIVYSFQEIYQVVEAFMTMVLSVRQNFQQLGQMRSVELSDNQKNNVVYTIIQYLATYYGSVENPNYTRGAQVAMFIFNDIYKSRGSYTLVNGDVQMNSTTKIMMINVQEILVIYKLMLIMQEKKFELFDKQILQFTGPQMKEINTKIIQGIIQLYNDYSDVDLPQSMQDQNIIQYHQTNRNLNSQTFDSSIYELLTRMLVQIYINSIKANSLQFGNISNQSCFQLCTQQIKRPYADTFTYFMEQQKLMYQYVYQNIGNLRNNQIKNQPLSQQVLQATFAQDNYNVYYGTMFYNITTSVGIVSELNVKILEACVYSKYQYINIASYSQLILKMEGLIIEFFEKTRSYRKNIETEEILIDIILYEFKSQIKNIILSLTGQTDENILSKSLNVIDVRLINILFIIYYICDIVRIESDTENVNHYKLKPMSYLALLTGEISEVAFGNLSNNILNIAPVVNPIFNVNMLSQIYSAIDVMYNNQQILNKYGGAFRFVSVGYYLIKIRNTQQTRSIDKILALLYKKDQSAKQQLSNWQSEYTHASYMSAMAKYIYFGNTTSETIQYISEYPQSKNILEYLKHIVCLYYTNAQGFQKMNSIVRQNKFNIKGVVEHVKNARNLHGPRYAHFLRAQNNAMAYPKFFVEQILQYYNKTYEDINQSMNTVKNAIPFIEGFQDQFDPHTNQMIDFMHQFLTTTRDLLLTESSKSQQNLDVALPPYFFYDYAAINGFRGIRDNFQIEDNMYVLPMFGLPIIQEKYFQLVRKLQDERPTLIEEENIDMTDYDEDKLDIWYESVQITDQDILNMFAFNPYNSFFTDYVFYDQKAKENRFQRSDWPVDDVQKFITDNSTNYQQLKDRFTPKTRTKTLQEIFSGYDDSLLYGPTNLMLLIFFARKIQYFVPDMDETATIYEISKITEDQKDKTHRLYDSKTLEDFKQQLLQKAVQTQENQVYDEQHYIKNLINNYQLLMLDLNQAATNYHVDQLRPRNALERKLNYISNLSMTNYVTYKQKFIKSILILSKFFPKLYKTLMDIDFKLIDKQSKYCQYVIVQQSNNKSKQVPTPNTLDIPKIDDTILKMAEYEQAQAEKRIAQTVLAQTQTAIKNMSQDELAKLKDNKTKILQFSDIKHKVESANQVFQYLTSYQAAQIYDFMATFYGYYYRELLYDFDLNSYTLPRFYLTKEFYDIFVKNVESIVKQKLITAYNASYVVIAQLQYKIVFDDITTFTKINFYEGSFKPVNYVLTKDYLTEYVKQRVQIQVELNQKNAYAKSIDDKLAELQLLQSTAITIVNQLKKTTDDITLATSRKQDVTELIKQREELQAALNQTRLQIDEANQEVDSINAKMQSLKDYYDMRYSKQAANIFNSELQLNLGNNVKIMNKMRDTMQKFSEIAAQLVITAQAMANYQDMSTLDRARLLKEFAKITNSLRQVSKDTEKDLQEASKDVVQRQKNINDIQKNGRGNVRQALYSYAVKVFEEREKTIRDSIILDEKNFKFKELTTQQLRKFVEAQSIRKALGDLAEFTNKYIENNYDNPNDKIIEKLKEANPDSLKNRASFSNTIKMFTQQQATIKLTPEQVDSAIEELKNSIEPEQLSANELQIKADAQTKIQNIINRVTSAIQPRESIDYIIPDIPKPDQYIAQTAYSTEFFRQLYVDDLRKVGDIIKRVYTLNNIPFDQQQQQKLQERMNYYNSKEFLTNHIGQRFAALSLAYRNSPGERAALTNLYVQLFRSGNWDQEIKDMVEQALTNNDEIKGEMAQLYELSQSELEQFNEDRVKMLMVYNPDGTLNRQLSKLQYIKLLNQWFQFKFQIADQDVLLKTITKIKDTTLATGKQLIAQITFSIEVDLRTMKDLFVEDFLREQRANNQDISVFIAMKQFKEFMNLRALDIYRESYTEDIQYIFN